MSVYGLYRFAERGAVNLIIGLFCGFISLAILRGDPAGALINAFLSGANFSLAFALWRKVP